MISNQTSTSTNQLHYKYINTSGTFCPWSHFLRHAVYCLTVYLSKQVPPVQISHTLQFLRPRGGIYIPKSSNLLASYQWSDDCYDYLKELTKCFYYWHAELKLIECIFGEHFVFFSATLNQKTPIWYVSQTPENLASHAIYQHSQCCGVTSYM